PRVPGHPDRPPSTVRRTGWGSLMAKIHEIGIGADTRAFEDNIKRGVINPTEEAEKALKELGDTDAGRDAARDLEKVEDALKQDVIRPAKDAEEALKDV